MYAIFTVMRPPASLCDNSSHIQHIGVNLKPAACQIIHRCVILNTPIEQNIKTDNLTKVTLTFMSKSKTNCDPRIFLNFKCKSSQFNAKRMFDYQILYTLPRLIYN